MRKLHNYLATDTLSSTSTSYLAHRQALSFGAPVSIGGVLEVMACYIMICQRTLHPSTELVLGFRLKDAIGDKKAVFNARSGKQHA